MGKREHRPQKRFLGKHPQADPSWTMTIKFHNQYKAFQQSSQVFPSGTAPRPSCLRANHVKEALLHPSPDHGNSTLKSLTDVVNLVAHHPLYTSTSIPATMQEEGTPPWLSQLENAPQSVCHGLYMLMLLLCSAHFQVGVVVRASFTQSSASKVTLTSLPSPNVCYKLIILVSRNVVSIPSIAAIVFSLYFFGPCKLPF